MELILIDAADQSSEPQTRTTAPFRGKPNGPDTVPGPVPGPEPSAGVKCVIGQKNNPWWGDNGENDRGNDLNTPWPNPVQISQVTFNPVILKAASGCCAFSTSCVITFRGHGLQHCAIKAVFKGANVVNTSQTFKVNHPRLAVHFHYVKSCRTEMCNIIRQNSDFHKQTVCVSIATKQMLNNKDHTSNANKPTKLS